jgi:branched-chain amino acid transport system ATP-binding protein
MAGPTEKLRASDDIQEFYLGKTEESERGQKRWKRRKTWR